VEFYKKYEILLSIFLQNQEMRVYFQKTPQQSLISCISTREKFFHSGGNELVKKRKSLPLFNRLKNHANWK